MDLSFSGAGFMGTYYIGVIDCWSRFVPEDRINRLAGASAGSLISAYYAMGEPLEKCLNVIMGLIEGVRQRPLGVFDRKYQIVDLLPAALNELFPDDAHKRATNKVHIVMTRLKDMKKVTISQFDTKQELIDALNCSCFIPVWSGNHCSTYKGEKYIDGGFSDNLPVFDEHTVRICCFAGHSDIAPYDKLRSEVLSTSILNTPVYFNMGNFRRLGKALFPPSPSFVHSLLLRGFHDTKDFILTHDIVQCDECHKQTALEDMPIYALQAPTLTPAVSRSNSCNNLVDVGKLKDNGLKEQKHKDNHKKTKSSSSSLMSLANIFSNSTNTTNTKQQSHSDFLKVNSNDTNQESATEYNNSKRRRSSEKSFTAMLRKKLGRKCANKQTPTTNSTNHSSNIGFDSEMLAAKLQVPTIETTDYDDEQAKFACLADQLNQVTSNELVKGVVESDTSGLGTSATTSLLSQSSSDDCEEEEFSAKERERREEKENAYKIEEDEDGDGDIHVRTKFALAARRRQSEPNIKTKPSESPSESLLSQSESLTKKQRTTTKATKWQTDVAGRRKSRAMSLATDSLFSSAPRFSLAPTSCPPSPSLNRHCAECLRLRSLVRQTELSEELIAVAQKFISGAAGPDGVTGKLTGKLGAPARWYRKLESKLAGNKYSYKLQESLPV